jgi:hypothetical protein
MSKKIKKECENCKSEFEDYISNNRKFCSRKCSDSGRKKNGLSGEKWYKVMSHIDMGKYWRGKKNPNHSEKMKGCIPWNKGKQNVQEKLYGENHPGIKYKMKKLGLDWDTYNNWKHNKNRYKKEVWRITNQQEIYKLKNYDKPRKRAGYIGGYQLDHIMSIDEGWSKQIDPNVIGNINNLQFITWEKNLKKRYEKNSVICNYCL